MTLTSRGNLRGISASQSVDEIDVLPNSHGVSEELVLLVPLIMIVKNK